MELNFSLHPQQMKIANSKARFKVCAAGRRGGKSFYAAISCLIEGLKNEKNGFDLALRPVYYISPTFDQSKRNVWDLIKVLGGFGTKDSVIESVVENQGVIRLVNGRKIELKGADRPDTLRGVGLSYVVLDEYAFMKPDVWEVVVSPTLTDVEGDALFIGTPEGTNHFYDLYVYADSGKDPEWAAFTFRSMDNPALNRKEVEKARGRLSAANFKQEYEASFKSSSGIMFKEEYFKYLDEEPETGTWYVAVDPAGFSDFAKESNAKISRLDECAIACVKVGDFGWYVGDIFHGRWGVKETAKRILYAASRYKALVVGIEGGSLKNAVTPYLTDEMLRVGNFPKIHEVTHGGQKKVERIAWALEGRFEHGRLYFRKDAEYLKALTNQLLDFPNPLSHDDLIDALAYIDQLAETDWDGLDIDPDEEDDWDDFDLVGRNETTGY